MHHSKVLLTKFQPRATVFNLWAAHSLTQANSTSQRFELRQIAHFDHCKAKWQNNV